MSQGTTPRNHPNAPHNQPFQGAGRKNLTKKNSWWNVNSPNYWRNAKKAKKDKAERLSKNRKPWGFLSES